MAVTLSQVCHWEGEVTVVCRVPLEEKRDDITLTPLSP